MQSPNFALGRCLFVLLTLAATSVSATEYRIIDLVGLPGCVASYAYGINGSGQVVGAVRLTNGNMRACVWQNGNAYDLGGLPGYTSMLS